MSFTRLVLSVLILFIFLQSLNAFQFILPEKTRKCFQEDVPLSTKILFTYTVAQGTGEMPVSLRIMDMTGKAIVVRQAIDHGLFAFRSPDRIPNVPQRNDWSLRDDDTDDDAYFRAIPDGAGDNRVRYTFCFEHASSLHFPHLRVHGHAQERQIIFSIKSGTDAKTLEYYDKLAKEWQLTTTEKAFHIVEDSVSEIVRLVDEMRERELRVDHINKRTQRMVTMYAILTCTLIAAGAVYSSYATFTHLSQEKRV
ncbi:unnamed protein product [Agarophyton chilense]